MSDVFLDTNILVYAATGMLSAPDKHKMALEIVDQGNFAVSAQVLQEFYVNVTRQKRDARPLSHEKAQEIVERFAMRRCAETDSDLVLRAIAMSQRHRISYWDAAIIAGAETLGCETVYSEDLSDGQRYGAVTVVNPFVDVG